MTLFADRALNETKEWRVGSKVHDRTENCQVFNSVAAESADQIRRFKSAEGVDQIDTKVTVQMKNRNSIEMLHDEM